MYAQFMQPANKEEGDILKQRGYMLVNELITSLKFNTN